MPPRKKKPVVRLTLGVKSSTAEPSSSQANDDQSAVTPDNLIPSKSRKRTRESPDAVLSEAASDVIVGPRQAKANALQKQVWIAVDGTATARKKLAEVGQPSEQQPKKQQQQRKTKKPYVHVSDESSDDEHNKENIEPVRIPVPPAPRKPQPQKRTFFTIAAPEGAGKHKMTYSHDDPFVDEDELSSYGDDSSASEGTSDSGANEDKSSLESNAVDEREDAVRASTTATSENPLWPSISSTQEKMPKRKFILKSVPMEHVIEETTESPTEHLASEAKSESKGKQVLQRRKTVTQPKDVFPPLDILSDDDFSTEPTWPDWTDLKFMGVNNSLRLTDQEIEIQLVLRGAMVKIEERIIFEDSFPRGPIRVVWNRRAIQHVCEKMEEMSSDRVKAKYRMIYDRSRSDPEYMREISTLLNPRISAYRGEAKVVASSYIKLYGIFTDNKVDQFLVNNLLTKNQYIYVWKGRDYDRTKPYQHQVIVDVIRRIFFMTKSPITETYPERFKPEDGETLKLAPSMIALAATAVHCALDEWRDGTHRQVNFGINMYTNVYKQHLSALSHIESGNKRAYDFLVRKLYRLASALTINTDAIAAPDVEHMDMQEDE